jgi:hypothetical protein
MSCSECVHLSEERDRLFRAYANAVAVLKASRNASHASIDAEHHRKLLATTDEARMKLILGDSKFRQHQDMHAVPNWARASAMRR